MRNLDRRVSALEGPSTDYLTIGELLDSLDDVLEPGREPHPDIVAALDAVPTR